METYYAKTVNFDKLLAEIRASYPNADLASGDGLTLDAGVRVIMPDGTSEGIWGAIGVIVNAHNASSLTSDQQLTNAQAMALNNARVYLRTQLLSTSPNISNIYTTVKNYVDNNPYLLQMMTNKLTLANLAYGWSVANMNNPTTNNHRAQYLECVQSLLGILA